MEVVRRQRWRVVAIFAAPIDLRKKFIFACISIVPEYGDSIKGRIKVRTTQKVSNHILKWPILEQKRLFLRWSPSLGVRPRKKVNKEVNKSFSSFLSLFLMQKVGFCEGSIDPRGLRCIYSVPSVLITRLMNANSATGAKQIHQESWLFRQPCRLSILSIRTSSDCIRSQNLCLTGAYGYGLTQMKLEPRHPGASELNTKVSESYAISTRLLQTNRLTPKLEKLSPFLGIVTNWNLNNPPLQPNSRLHNEEFVNASHRKLIVKMRLLVSLDVEMNPGPGCFKKKDDSTVMVTSYNVRGLNDEKKLRHLINFCYGKIQKDKDQFFLFQETFLTKPSIIPYLWRGNLHFTPGSGNGSGCVTLLSSHINVVHSTDLGMRGHILVCQKSGDQKISYIIANIYAPCPNNQEKITFFEGIFDKLSELIITYECNNIICAGDFNLNFAASEVKNRNYSAQERRVAQVVMGFLEGMGLADVWKEAKKRHYTWQRSNSDTFSTIDRILLSNTSLKVKNVSTNWSLSMSDHAAIELTLTVNGEIATNKSKITRLDPSLLKNPDCKAKIIENFESMLALSGDGWNPHLKLEYAKMCIRTVVEQVQADRKKKELSEEEELNEELNIAVISLESSGSDEEKEELIEYIEELRGKKAMLIEDKGRRLAEKLGTKWYNEGEKSTRYFLNLLKRPAPDIFKSIVDSNGREINAQEEVAAEIVSFYKSLYEDYDKGNLVNTATDNLFFEHINPVSGGEANDVTRPITIQDLEKTIMTCSDSAPGPDGIPYSFYKALWRTMGTILVEAWNQTISTGNLCPSHKVSFLRLIPKVGKDLKKLTNWRPITLSNCDHKLITKTYANRLSNVVAQEIKERQTAYLKGRLINDNVRAIIATIELTNAEEDLDGLLVSLDAKKAFDSVEHSFIEKCLRKFGLETFVPIFKSSTRS